MTAEELRTAILDNSSTLRIIAGLDEKGIEQVEYFALGVKARAEYERQKQQEEPDQKAG